MRKALVFLFVLSIQSQASFAESIGNFLQRHDVELPELRIETNAVTSEQQERRERINAEREIEKQRKRQKAKAYKDRWREINGVFYDWEGWKLSRDGIRTTAYRNSLSISSSLDGYIAVDCKSLKVSSMFFIRSGWSKWAAPSRSQDQMVLDLCSNIGTAHR